MSEVKQVSISTFDPRDPLAIGIRKTVDKADPNDRVTVEAMEEALLPDGTQVVLVINADPGATARMQDTGTVGINASGGGMMQYVVVDLQTRTPDNWSFKVQTSGGSTYTFRKGGSK